MRVEWVIGGGIVASIVTALGLAWFLRPGDIEVNGEASEGNSGATGDAGDPIYVLARVIASEEGGASRRSQEAVGCACVNFAQSAFPSLSAEDAVIRLALGSAGAFGRQGSGGRRVSTSHEPGALQLEIARGIFDGSIADPTGGATQWDSPAGQRALLARGDSLTVKTPEQVADQRYSAGYSLVAVPGIDVDKLRFWVRA